METLIGALVVLTVASLSLAGFALHRAHVANGIAMQALGRIADMSMEDRVRILPDGVVRVDGIREDHFHVVFLGDPAKNTD